MEEAGSVAVRTTSATRISILPLLSFIAFAASAAHIDANWFIAAPHHPDPAVNLVFATAARELQADILEASGIELKIAETGPSANSRAFRLGKDEAARAGFDVSRLSDWDNVYAENGGGIYFYGDDRPVRTGLKALEKDLRFTVYPTARAVARFLRDICGVRFVMPGRIGTSVPRLDAISVPGGTYSFESPSQKFGSYTPRTGSLMFATANSYFPPGDLFSYGGHTYPAACPRERYFKDHPEYFQMRGGKRRWADGPAFQALCISNPAVEELIVAELERRFDDGAKICQLSQQDGLDFCECDKCRALYGVGDDWGEKYWIFHRRIAERILRERPGKTVHILSYAQTAHPPKTFRKFPENVMVELCKNSDAAFAEWEGYTVPQGFSVYIYHWNSYVRVGYTPHRSLYECHASARRYVKNGSRGVYRCGDNLGLVAIEGPQYWIFNNTLENPDLDVGAALAEFCAASFGREAAGPMVSFYETLDMGLRGFDRIVAPVPDVPGADSARYSGAQPDFPLDVISYIYTPDVLGAMEGALAAAEKSKTATPREKARLARCRTEFDYTANLARIAAFFRAYQTTPCKANFLPLAGAVRERREMLDRLFAGGETVRLAGWPDDAILFGRDGRRGLVEVNGRSGAVIVSPLDWDVDRMLREEDYPWTAGSADRWRQYNKKRGLAVAKNWKVYGKARPDVVSFERGGARVRFGTVSGTGASVVAHVKPEGGLKPNTRYRVSCFARADYIAPVWGTRYGQERGLFFLFSFDGARGVQSPPRAAFRGAFDWRRICVEFTTPEKPSSAVDAKALLCNSNGIVEVEDLTIEELERNER